MAWRGWLRMGAVASLVTATAPMVSEQPSGALTGSTTGATVWTASALSPAVAPTNLDQPGRSIVRDGGFSTPTARSSAPSLWFFDDTSLIDPNGKCFVADGSASVAPVVPGEAPELAEATQTGADIAGYSNCSGHSNVPYQSIPVPPRCSGSGNAHAWVTGLNTTGGTVTPSDTAIITYADQCFSPQVTTGSFVTVYSVSDTSPQIVQPPLTTQASLAPYITACGTSGDTSGWQSPVVYRGYLYLFDAGQSNPAGRSSGECNVMAVARAPIAGNAFLDAASYQYLTSNGSWSPDARLASGILPTAGPGRYIGTLDGELSVAEIAGGEFVMAYLSAQDGRVVTVRVAPTPVGPWSSPESLTMPQGFNSQGGLNYQVVVHPELDTSTQLVLSYATWRGRVRFASAPLAGLPSPIVTAVPTSSSLGYWEATSSGSVTGIGDAGYFGSAQAPTSPIVAMAVTPDGGGYWLATSDGHVSAFGDAVLHGSMGGTTLNQPIVAMASTPDGGGYWLAASDGGIFSFGDARFHGSMGGTTLNQPIVAMASTPDGAGYWEVASDGGIFSFGDARFFGSTGNLVLARPVVGIAPTSDGLGYWLAASDGGIFTFGDAGFYGSSGGGPQGDPVVAMSATLDGHGYWEIDSTGTLSAYGDAAHLA